MHSTSSVAISDEEMSTMSAIDMANNVNITSELSLFLQPGSQMGVCNIVQSTTAPVHNRGEGEASNL